VAYKCALVILDGLGISPQEKGNAVLQSNMPFFNGAINSYPKTLLKASGQEVGLPWGQFGNSEVGHTNIGLGRIVLQDLPQIDKSIGDNQLGKKHSIVSAKQKLSAGGNLHIIGILSDGGVHGHIDHIIAIAKEFAPTKTFIHAIADGRDVPEKSLGKFIEKIEKALPENAFLASVSGRFFAMDRDKNWERIQKAYDAIIGKGAKFSEGVSGLISENYKSKITDEFFDPTILCDYKMDFDNDVVIFTNYRADRAIQLSRAFVDQSTPIKKSTTVQNFYCMTTYDDNLRANVLFSNINLNDPKTNPLVKSISELLSLSNKKQLHIAETEKFAHVTYFFNGGVKEPFAGQQNILVPSPKVKSYDLQPKMSADKIVESLSSSIDSQFDFILINFANPDMVGHSGNLNATVEALEYLDHCLSAVCSKMLQNGYEVFISADHGNCDEMIDLSTGNINKEHSLNPVPFIYLGHHNCGKYQIFDEFIQTQPIAVLADISPTILNCFGIPLPSEMAGVDLRPSLI